MATFKGDKKYDAPKDVLRYIYYPKEGKQNLITYIEANVDQVNTDSIHIQLFTSFLLIIYFIAEHGQWTSLYYFGWNRTNTSHIGH